MCSPIDECYKELYEEEEKYKEIVCEKKLVLEKVSNAEKRVTSLKDDLLNLTKKLETTKKNLKEEEAKSHGRFGSSIMRGSSGSSGLLDFASLFLLLVLLGSFQVFDYRVTTTFDKPTSWNFATRTLQSPVPPSWFSHIVQFRLIHHRRRAFLQSGVPYDVDGARLFHLIKLSGDVHPNPGPPRQRIKYPCGECNRNVRSNQDAILCSECDRWFHAKCIGMRRHIFKYYLEQHHLDWQCSFCSLPRLNDSFFKS